MGKKGIILVTGATGRQGNSVTKKLLKLGWNVRAMTRRPESHESLRLRSLGADIVQADLSSRTDIERAMQGVNGVFCVTDFWEHGYQGELDQGKRLIDAAAQASVQHFIFNSVGGTDRTEGLGIRHFDSKREIEKYLKESKLPHTIFRPVTFFENFTSLRFRRQIYKNGIFRFTILPNLKFQMVAMEDVGEFVAMAFESPEKFIGISLELASDQFTMLEFANAIQLYLGRPVRYQYLPVALQWIIASFITMTRSNGYFKVGNSLIRQFKWNHANGTGGWEADIPGLRKLNPNLATVDTWVKSVDWKDGLDH